jgi:hypothetical protein
VTGAGRRGAPKRTRTSTRSSRTRPRLGTHLPALWRDVKIQNGKFALAGKGLNIGRDGGSPVTWDYPGEQPWAFAGGTIQRVIVDASGEPYIDLEKEAMAVLSRE